MKNFIYGLLLLTSISFAHEYEFTDSDGFVAGSIEDNGSSFTIRDPDGFEIGSINQDGTVRDSDGFTIGEIESGN